MMEGDLLKANYVRLERDGCSSLGRFGVESVNVELRRVDVA